MNDFIYAMPAVALGVFLIFCAFAGGVAMLKLAIEDDDLPECTHTDHEFGEWTAHVEEPRQQRRCNHCGFIEEMWK